MAIGRRPLSRGSRATIIRLRSHSRRVSGDTRVPRSQPLSTAHPDASLCLSPEILLASASHRIRVARSQARRRGRRQGHTRWEEMRMSDPTTEIGQRMQTGAVVCWCNFGLSFRRRLAVDFARSDVKGQLRVVCFVYSTIMSPPTTMSIMATSFNTMDFRFSTISARWWASSRAVSIGPHDASQQDCHVT